MYYSDGVFFFLFSESARARHSRGCEKHTCGSLQFILGGVCRLIIFVHFILYYIFVMFYSLACCNNNVSHVYNSLLFIRMYRKLSLSAGRAAT